MEYLSDLIYLIPLLFIAGVLDGIAGGGGIIALPAYLLTGMPIHSAYACNKLQSGCGTLCSGIKYIKEKLCDIRVALIALPFTVLSSMLATKAVLNMDGEKIKLIIAVCIPLAVILMFSKRKIGSKSETRHKISPKVILLSILSGAILGTYDALFGPGGGSIAIIIFSLLLSYELRVGCGNGKIIIVVSNFTALINYIIGGHIIWHVAIPCTLSNMLGSYIGAVMAVKKGEKIVFPAMLAIIATLVVQTVFKFFF
ncbi:MAG: sulfite exporter TauE/SafE family protein [Oscillospiraceae bacterium]|nr:sulfite exporter TauE/SafE family protein [Oscillospiraceae bacterium]MBQ4545056.1 sulfite exporter TauE/SafE family protein [Oscillospiraceae bacterium]